MLRIKRMEISGFKSFGDRTEVQLPDGITAVVGPNGCGKSNIGDAINWVLGEQSAKMLRGKQMADVIFNGSAERKPTGFAEVTLHLRGVGGEAGSEAQISRRLYRTGESEYALNGKRARLKDIESLLREERVGAKTYATIEQGRIDQILNAKPKERRLIIEEAAGVAGFKHKRRLTELKLEATAANLLRVNDIVVEVERQINSLKRQAARARRYKKLRDEMRARQFVRFGTLAREMDAQIEALRGVEDEAKRVEAQVGAQLASLESEIADKRERLERGDEEHRGLGERLHALDLEIDRSDARIAVLVDRHAESLAAAERLGDESRSLGERRGGLGESLAEHERQAALEVQEFEGAQARLTERQARLDRLEVRYGEAGEEIERARATLLDAVNRLSELRNRRRRIDESRERNAGQRQRLAGEHQEVESDRSRFEEEMRRLADEVARQRGEVERLDGELQSAESGLAAARREHEAAVEELSAARTLEETLGARLATLEDISTRFAGVSDGVRTLLAKGAEAGIRTCGVIADFVEAGRDVESVAESYLQSFLPTVIVEEDDDACRAVEMLRAEGAGRTALISRSQPAGHVVVGSPGNGRAPDVPRALLDDPRVIGRLRDRLQLKTSVNGVVQNRIGDALLVDRLDSALALHRDHPGFDYLTREGEVVYASGVVLAGGQTEDRHGLLAHSRRMQDVRGEHETAARGAAEKAEREGTLRRRCAALQEELAGGRERLEEARRRSIEFALRVERSSDDRERSDKRAGLLQHELAVLDEEVASLSEQERECAAQLEQAEREHGETEARVAALAAALQAIDGERREAAEAAAIAREDLASRRQRRVAHEVEHDRLRGAVDELTGRLAEIGSERQLLQQRAAEAEQEKREIEARLVEAHGRREELRRGQESRRQSNDELRTDLQRSEQSVVALRTDLERRRRASHEGEVARVKAVSERGHLEAMCQEELGLSTADAAERAAALAEPAENAENAENAEPDLEQLEATIEELRGKIERIGPVNILAIDEFTELEERHTFLTAQRDDLERSIHALQETIRRINRQSRERFSAAFEAIRVNFQDIFKLLFRGGRADLRLEEGEDILECGIEIMAQPPGKRLTTVNLLSGGEKAMSAIALLFAIFRYRPSPFCLLDEVDAPLDDVNIGRFTRLLREYAANTQFIIITHNKLSMEAADSLYGVTMPQPGVSHLMSMELQ